MQLCCRLAAVHNVVAARMKLFPVLLITLQSLALVPVPGAVSFSREVLPILSENCLSCHGQDESHRKAGLRLDVREGAVAVKDGIAAIVPGKPESSELIKRLITSDADELMPPGKSHKLPLKPAEVEKLRRWIAEGATWGKHWSFEKPVKAPLPAGVKNPVDALVSLRHATEGLTLAKRAAPHTLLRRVSYDLVGLPPSAGQIAAFQSDPSPVAFAAEVDRLLASPHFGERLAMWWLDAARYADTDGFQSDATRTNWPWRDWVVNAFNSGMPFDQFTLEQFAGDLLPNATADQKLATCFHRNHMTNGEGGRDPEESRVDYVLDRINTVGSTWLGLTLGCTQCHSHKFDPVSHSEYYSMAAFFNSIDEDGKAGTAAKPYLSYSSPYAQRALAEAQSWVGEKTAAEAAARKEAEQPFQPWLAAQLREVSKGFTAWHPLRGKLESSEGTQLAQDASAVVQASGPNLAQDDYRLIAPVRLTRVTGLRLEVLPHASHTGGAYSRGKSGDFILTDIKVQVRRAGSSQVRDVKVSSAVADAAVKSKSREYGEVSGVLDDDPRNGWTTKGMPQNATRTAVFGLAEPLLLEADEELVFELRQRSTLGDANIGRFRVSVTDQAGPALKSIGSMPLEDLAAARPADLWKLEASLRARLLEQFLADYAPYQDAKAALDRAKAQMAEAKAAGKVNVMVLADRKEPRATHVLLRGVWDKPGDKVQPGGIAAILPWSEAEPRSRLGLAHWITSRDNPLTARVMVNHLWQMCFGTGLVRTAEDFGLQGEQPAHPEVLDWLAVEFMESGWNLKHILKLIVTSDTYGQSSEMTPAMLQRDPENRLLARGARFRLPSWMLRDAVLQHAGLLNPDLGGPPVRPYQPEGVWEELFMGRYTYVPSDGAAQYRRTLYAFWRRSIAPTFLFDSAQRRSCEVRTGRTNTPLQALTLLNDETFLEAARALADRGLSQPVARRLAGMHLKVLGRPPSDREAAILQREYDRALSHYASHGQEAAVFVAVGQRPAPTQLPELAASMVVASMLLNLDEAITHE